MQNEHHPTKKDTQVDRIIFFSDAVFAIAITLLVIDLKVPKIEGTITDQNFILALSDELPQLSGFILSFFIIGLYWSVHHSIFGFVINYSKKLLWLNLIFLFTIVLMPFSTSVYSEYSFSVKYVNLLIPFAVYVLNIIMIGLMNVVLNRYIFNSKNNVADGYSRIYVKYGRLRALAIPLVFSLALLVGYFNVILGKYVLFLIPIAMAFLGSAHRKELRKENFEI